MKKFFVLLILVVPAFLLSGCFQYKKIAYFQDSRSNTNVPVKKRTTDTIVIRDSNGKVIDTSGKNIYLLRIQPFDVLDIHIKSSVSSFDEIFGAQESATGTSNATSSSNSIAIAPLNGYYIGYVTDADGFLNLPVIGKVYIKNLTLGETAQLITDKLKGYVIEPFVQVKFLAFRISVLGEVKGPGQIVIASEKANLIDALSLAGDLTDYGNRKEIQVIRGPLQNPVTYTLDITSLKCLNSQGFTLQPNDIIYVRPLKRKFLLTNLTTIVSIISLLSASIALIYLSKI